MPLPAPHRTAAGCLLAALAALPACGEPDESGATREALPGERAFAFAAGDFQLTTHLVDDRCLEGALNLLFMPNGQGVPWDWEFPVRLHPPEALPLTYDVPLRAPFGTIRVTFSPVTRAEERAQGAQNTGVLLDADLWGQCVADLDADFAIDLVSADRVAMEGFVALSNPRGDERCPALPDGCQVVLSVEGARLP